MILVSACSQVETMPKPKPLLELTGRVVDKADLLDLDTEKRIETKLADAERRYGPQLVVATTPSLEGREIEDYSFDLAQSWGIGDKERLDGLVLLVAPNERKVRIEVGFGLEGSFTDEYAGQILRETILPQFRDGNLAEGIEAGVDRMIAKMKAVPTLPANDNAASDAKDEAA